MPFATFEFTWLQYWYHFHLKNFFCFCFCQDFVNLRKGQKLLVFNFMSATICVNRIRLGIIFCGRWGLFFCQNLKEWLFPILKIEWLKSCHFLKRCVNYFETETTLFPYINWRPQSWVIIAYFRNHRNCILPSFKVMSDATRFSPSQRSILIY